MCVYTYKFCLELAKNDSFVVRSLQIFHLPVLIVPLVIRQMSQILSLNPQIKTSGLNKSQSTEVDMTHGRLNFVLYIC